MHEQAIANRIIEEAKKCGAVKGIVVEVGDLAHLPADEMRQVLLDRTEWDVTVVEKRALVECVCGYCGEPKIVQKQHDATLFECPVCGSLPLVKEGDQIVLKTVELQED
ncbi:hypothetical protein D6783_00560 [Candidatus Woesearchaeota archaeon]|nr:MAG: hypothetical protein D6783_00560 [Candidatus Woesearchaeota archaeon]